MAGLNMIPVSSAAPRSSSYGLEIVLRKETEKHRKDEEYEKCIVAVPFHTPPQWGAVVSIVSALLVAGEAGEGSLRQRETSAACARFLCLPPLQCFSMSLDNSIATVNCWIARWLWTWKLGQFWI